MSLCAPVPPAISSDPMFSRCMVRSRRPDRPDSSLLSIFISYSVATRLSSTTLIDVMPCGILIGACSRSSPSSFPSFRSFSFSLSFWFPSPPAPCSSLSFLLSSISTKALANTCWDSNDVDDGTPAPPASLTMTSPVLVASPYTYGLLGLTAIA